MASLSAEEIKQYSRHLRLAKFGMDAQLKLKNARVLVVGAGGLGCPALLYLTAAGIGTIGIADGDTVDLSNLQRQILFTVYDLQQNKAAVAADRLTQLNPHVIFQPYNHRITTENALNIFAQYDVVVDGSDNFPTRYLLNDACVLVNKPLIYGSILQYEGQVAVFNYPKGNGQYTANYRDLFPVPPDPHSVPNCEDVGVLGVLPGMIGSMQANECIKIITGIAEPLMDTLVLWDAETVEINKFKIINHNARASITKLIDYDVFCKSDHKNKSLNLHNNERAMKEITVAELKQMKDDGVDFQLIDVREPYEYDICNIDGTLIPLGNIPNNVDQIDTNRQVVIHCRSGKRSGDAINWLEQNRKLENLYNLKGGILAWADEIDEDMEKY